MADLRVAFTGKCMYSSAAVKYHVICGRNTFTAAKERALLPVRLALGSIGQQCLRAAVCTMYSTNAAVHDDCTNDLLHSTRLVYIDPRMIGTEQKMSVTLLRPVRA